MMIHAARNVLALILLSLSLAVLAPDAFAQTKSVVVLTVISDAAATDTMTDARLTQIREGIRDALKVNSFQEGKISSCSMKVCRALLSK